MKIPMKTNLSLSAPAELETEALVAVVLDRGEKDKPQIAVDSSDAAIKDAAADVLTSGEAVGKPHGSHFAAQACQAKG